MTFIKKQIMHNSRMNDEVFRTKRDYDPWRLLYSLAMADMGTAHWYKLTVIDADARFTISLRQWKILRELIDGMSENS